jgi:hypothetical protein
MKKILAALATMSLLTVGLAAAPETAAAQSRGGFHGGAGVHSGGGFRGGGFTSAGRSGFRGGGFAVNRGGFRGGYYNGWRGGSRYYGGVGLGFALGAALAYPWYNDYPAYWGPYGYYGGGYVTAVPAAPLYDDPWAYDYGSSSAYPAQPQAQAQPQACGAWSWNPGQNRYDWVPC